MWDSVLLKNVRRIGRYVIRYWKALPILVLLMLLASVSLFGRAPLVVPFFNKIFPEEAAKHPDLGFKPIGDGSTGAPRVLRDDPLPTQVWNLFDSEHHIAEEDRLYFLVLICALGMVLAVVGAAASYGKDVLGKYIGARVMIDIRTELFAHVSRLSLRFFQTRRTGDLVSRLTNDLGLTKKTSEFMLDEMLDNPIQILTGVCMAFAFSWKLAAIGLIVFPAVLLPLFRLGKRIRRFGRHRQAKLGSITELMMQLISGIRVIKAFKMEEDENRAYRARNREYLKRSMQLEKTKALTGAMTQFVYACGMPALLLGGGYLVLTHAMDGGRLFSFIFVLTLLYQPFKSLIKVHNELQESVAGSQRVFEILDTKPLIVDRPTARRLEQIEQGISFEKVSFAYDGALVLNDVNLEVRAGEMIAVVGPSGAGKTTMLDLIPRFYDPNGGRLTIDGVDIRDFSLESLLDQIGIVTQEPFLFNTTIEENLRYGKRDATTAELEAAARAANIHDTILALPEGYKTNVGERGVKFSGGQRQRLTIARAILNNPAILLLDEATSSLDSESERLVQDALERLMHGRTTFVIAHRFSTVLHADRILVLDRGRIVDIGTHQELVNRGGLYRKLYELQFSDDGDRRRRRA